MASTPAGETPACGHPRDRLIGIVVQSPISRSVGLTLMLGRAGQVTWDMIQDGCRKPLPSEVGFASY